MSEMLNYVTLAAFAPKIAARLLRQSNSYITVAV